MLENALNMIDLVLTHLTHPWGPPWTLETLGDLWRPLATMPENGQNGQNDIQNRAISPLKSPEIPIKNEK